MSQKFVSGESCQNPADLDETETLLDVDRPGPVLPDAMARKGRERTPMAHSARIPGLHMVRFGSVPSRLRNLCAPPRQCSAAGTPSLLYTVTGPVTGAGLVYGPRTHRPAASTAGRMAGTAWMVMHSDVHVEVFPASSVGDDGLHRGLPGSDTVHGLGVPAGRWSRWRGRSGSSCGCRRWP